MGTMEAGFCQWKPPINSCAIQPKEGHVVALLSACLCFTFHCVLKVRTRSCGLTSSLEKSGKNEIRHVIRVECTHQHYECPLKLISDKLWIHGRILSPLSHCHSKLTAHSIPKLPQLLSPEQEKASENRSKMSSISLTQSS